ncbi:GNAT family N-acetyltransferase [Virgibacillus sp. MSP4-1]|uniref:GNAT family N-acetyltransferase n=1 Tax=Virgibacillus sp. MSP4-1 TaxID=2700081 RepID=UPI0005C53F14|nr:GNAT family N-acetyltransferase [Virgibacillus sp. MSP4-1]QHS23455.1 GNAT family N-acetyltransferase [Virgibacillus sp. MSP4-1]
MGADGDVDFLWEMLYQAIFVPEGEQKPSREILSQPDISKYLDNWGRHGDEAYIATDLNNEPVGAIWIRLFDDYNNTFGYIDSSIPVLSMAVAPEFRGRGIGTLFLGEMMKKAKKSGFISLSLSVDLDNPAFRLYKRYGFKKVGINGTSYDMKVNLNDIG